jgi:hypothetical protein
LYINSYNDSEPKVALRTTLSTLLSEIENQDRRTQVVYLKPHQTGVILGWQVLRDQAFFDGKAGHPVLELHSGELLGWDAHYDRDIFLSRVPYRDVVSGYALNPGRKCIDSNQDIYNDERGLYLPIYDPEVFMNIYNKEIQKYKSLVVKYLQEVKGVPHTMLAMY